MQPAAKRPVIRRTRANQAWRTKVRLTPENWGRTKQGSFRFGGVFGFERNTMDRGMAGISFSRPDCGFDASKSFGNRRFFRITKGKGGHRQFAMSSAYSEIINRVAGLFFDLQHA